MRGYTQRDVVVLRSVAAERKNEGLRQMRVKVVNEADVRRESEKEIRVWTFGVCFYVITQVVFGEVFVKIRY